MDSRLIFLLYQNRRVDYFYWISCLGVQIVDHLCLRLDLSLNILSVLLRNVRFNLKMVALSVGFLKVA
jgi:hypothetical protein